MNFQCVDKIGTNAPGLNVVCACVCLMVILLYVFFSGTIDQFWCIKFLTTTQLFHNVSIMISYFKVVSAPI